MYFYICSNKCLNINLTNLIYTAFNIHVHTIYSYTHIGQ